MPLELDTLDDADKPVKRRLKLPDNAYKIFTTFSQADADAAWNRGIVRRWTNGEPPQDQQDMDDAGMGWCSNVNSLKASADREQAVGSFNNLLSSVPHLCEFSTTYGKEEDRKPWMDIISEEYDWLFKEHWRSFYSLHKKTADAFITDGLGVRYWPDDQDWRFKVGRLGDFLFAPDADVDEEQQEIVLFVEEYSFSQLIKLLDSDKKVRDGEDGDTSLINRDAIIDAIKDLTKDSSTAFATNADEFLRRMEENALLYDYAKSQKIKLVHYYVKEASGKITHSIGRADGKNKEYLSDRYEAYGSMSEVFVFFADGVGSWKLSSIKGQIYKALPLYMRSDVILNKLDDALILSLMKWLQSTASSGKKLLSQLTLGSLSILPPEIKFIDLVNHGDNGSQAFPLLAQYDRLTGNNTGGYQSHAISPEGGNRTAREVSLQAASTANLSTAKLGDYYEAEDKTHQNCYARLTRDNWVSSDCGYEGMIEFTDRCRRRGVPMEAIRQARPKTIRAIGYGSIQQQQMAFDTLRGLIQYMSPGEQLNLAKDIAAALPGVGYDKIARYLGDTVKHTPDGTREALNEHDTFRGGIPRPVFEDDAHFVHIPIHFTLLSGTMQALQQNAIDVAGALKQMGPTMDHANQHLQLAAKDASKQDALKDLHRQFGQFDALFKKLQEQAQKEQPQGQNVSPDPKDGVDDLNALAGLYKAGAPVTATQLNAALVKAGLPPLDGQTPPLPPPPNSQGNAADGLKAQADIVRENALAQAEIERENAKTQNHIQTQNIRTGAHVQAKALQAAGSIDPATLQPAPQPQFVNNP